MDNWVAGEGGPPVKVLEKRSDTDYAIILLPVMEELTVLVPVKIRTAVQVIF
jgi:hypothetical protein